MQALIHHGAKKYRVDFCCPLDISIPLKPGEKNVNAFFAPPFEAAPVVAGTFTGLVEAGSPVNFQNIRLNPHGNGTHTECVGHITEEKFTVNQCLKNFFFMAELVSAGPVQTENGDTLILREQIEKLLGAKRPEALVLRTLPNDTMKLSRNYSGENPPYLHHALADYLVAIGVKHLLVDLPSVDREQDEGRLLFHKAFWQYPDDIRKNSTITELIYVPDEVKDGTYLLNLQIASFELDAGPSKPVLYRLARAAD